MARYIVLIDDDITALDLCAYLVEKQGYEVERRADGLSALHLIKSRPPDLVVVDLLMPHIDGKETVRQIRALGYTTLPILAFTAVDDPRLHAEAIEAGCNEVLTKPCRPERFVRRIEELLAKSGPQH